MIVCCNSRRIRANESPIRSKSKPKQRTSEICPKFSQDKWIEVMKGSVEKQGYSELSYNLRHNFPWKLRSQVWLWLTEKGRMKHLYQKLVLLDSPSEEQIKRDMHRSFTIRGEYRLKNNSKTSSENSESNSCGSDKVEIQRIDKQKLEKLGRILTAYSNLDKEVQYVQGMNFIAASIIDQIGCEELSFIVLNYILNIQNYRKGMLYYMKVFQMNMSIMEIIEKRISFEVPIVYQKMQELKVKAQQCFDYLIFSLFQLTRKELAIRIIDIFLFEKESIIQTVIIQILKIQQVEILKCQDQDEMLIYIRNELIDDALDKLDDRSDYLSQLLSVCL